MKPKLLTALEPSDQTQAVLGELGRGDFQVEYVDGSQAALRWLSESEPPGGVLAQLDQRAPGFLELLAAIDRLSLPIPVLGTANGGLVKGLPIGTISLTLLDLELPTGDFVSRVISTLSNAANKNHIAVRKGVDYLLPAILCRRSVNLELVTTDGLEVLVELVGGDVWNAYADDLEAVPALEAILFEGVRQFEVRALQTIPGERQMSRPGVEALGPGTRRLQPRGASSTGDQDAQKPRTTREIDIRAVVSELRSENERTAKLRGDSESPDERFERLLSTGIEASLSRDYPRASRAFEEALALKPDEPRARHNLERIQKHL